MSKVSTKTATYLLEIGCEEIPARFVEDFSECLKDNLVKAFKKERLLFYY